MQFLIVVHEFINLKQKKKAAFVGAIVHLYQLFSVSEPLAAASEIDTGPRQPYWCIGARDLILDVVISSLVSVTYA